MAEVIAVDGLGRTGKGTLASNLAKDIAVSSCPTSLPYRITAKEMLDAGIPPSDASAEEITSYALDLLPRMALHPDGLLLDNQEVLHLARSPEINANVAYVSTVLDVRRRLTEPLCQDMLRSLGDELDFVVMEGRDEALTWQRLGGLAFGVYLIASPLVQAQRELAAQEEGSTMKLVEAMYRNMERDARDMVKPEGKGSALPLRDAVVFDEAMATDDKIKILEQHGQLIIDTDDLKAEDVAEVVTELKDYYLDLRA